jgi:DNA-binding MarR family transcriptional regulator
MNPCKMKMPDSVIREKLKNEFPDTDFSGVDLMMQFGMTSRKMFTVLENYFSEYNLTKGKFHVLMMLYGKKETENIALSDISNRIQVTKSTITGLIDGLEKMGFAERYIKKGEDRRKIFIRITDAGDKFIKDFFPGHVQIISEVISDFTLEERQSLRLLLQKINSSLNNMKIKEGK